MDETTDDPSPTFSDDVDKALEHLWEGDSSDLSRLLGEETAGPSIGGIYAAVGAQAETLASTSQPDRIGDYRIIREIGRGGMGVVYEARQNQPDRLVALKVIRGPEQFDDLHIKLFQREVRTLARLQHPGIASVYSAGRTDDGRHYFAMELVEGETLSEFAHSIGKTKRAAAIPERLGLFCRICDAINHAHQRGVIHRDLKPSNVLVTEEPGSKGSSGAIGMSSLGKGVKILDFGLARLTEADDAHTTLVTEPGRIVGTLFYMSPEQARGDIDAIDLRSDVYSLGAILFELLTGELPHEINQASPQLAMQSICEAPPRRPSSLNHALRGEIETIVLKALEKDPTRRYQSAATFADDIRRHLTGQPILARPPSAAYQIRKLVTRHKMSAALAVLLLLSVIASAIVTGVLASQYAEQRDRALVAQQNEAAARKQAEESRDTAETESEKAQQIQQFLEDILASVDPNRAQGRDVGVLKDLLEEANRRVEAELSDQPEVAAAIRTTIGRTYTSLGLYDVAKPPLQAALSFHESEYGDNDPRITPALSNLGFLLTHLGEYEEAEQLLRRALAIQEDAGDDDLALAQCLVDLGRLFGYRNDYEPADEMLREALELRRSAVGDTHRLTADAAGNLAWLLSRREEVKEALPAFRQAYELCLVAYGETHPKTAMCLNNLASALKKAGEYADADEAYRDSVALQKQVLGDNHPDVADGMVSWGDLLKRMGRYDEARELLTEALEIQRQQLGESTDFYAATLAHIASVNIRQGNYEAAEAGYRDAAETYRTLHGDKHIGVLICRNGLASLLVKMGRYEEAEPILRELSVLFPEIYGANHPGSAVITSNLATALTHLEQFDEAEQLLREVLAFRLAHYGEEHPLVAKALHTLACVLHLKGDQEQAEELFTQCLEMQRKLEGERHPNVGATLAKLAALLADMDRPDEAARAFEEAYDIHSEAFEPGHPLLNDTVATFSKYLTEHGNLVDPAVANEVRQAYEQTPTPTPDDENNR